MWYHAATRHWHEACVSAKTPANDNKPQKHTFKLVLMIYKVLKDSM